jgi:sensor histidine kinase YesM
MGAIFWGSPSLDLKISLFLLGVSAFVSLIVLARKKKWIPALITFSVLANVSFLVNFGSFMFVVYDLIWFSYFNFLAWPIINIFLIIYYVQRKDGKKNNKASKTKK